MVGLSGSLGSTSSFPKSNLLIAYPATWLILLEPWVSRCGTCAHACSKCLFLVGGLFIDNFYSLYLHCSNHNHFIIQYIRLILLFLRLKINPLQAVMIVRAWCGHEYCFLFYLLIYLPSPSPEWDVKNFFCSCASQIVLKFKRLILSACRT
jgi:hypothetical protein